MSRVFFGAFLIYQSGKITNGDDVSSIIGSILCLIGFILLVSGIDKPIE